MLLKEWSTHQSLEEIMKRFWSSVVTAAFAASVGLAAQGGAPGAQGAPGAPPSPAGAQERPAPPQAGGGKVTISGCIQSAPASASAAAGAPAGGAGATASASAQNFVLANAKMASAGGAGAVGTSGTAAARYELDGDAKTISTHLNHQVEITGTVQSSSASATGAEKAAEGSRAAAPKLKVDSVKMVSATCQ